MSKEKRLEICTCGWAGNRKLDTFGGWTCPKCHQYFYDAPEYRDPPQFLPLATLRNELIDLLARWHTRKARSGRYSTLLVIVFALVAIAPRAHAATMYYANNYGSNSDGCFEAVAALMPTDIGLHIRASGNSYASDCTTRQTVAFQTHSELLIQTLDRWIVCRSFDGAREVSYTVAPCGPGRYAHRVSVLVGGTPVVTAQATQQ